MRPSDTALLIVDVQDRLAAVVRRSERIIWNCRRLLDAAEILNVRAAISEQLPDTLGATCEVLSSRVPEEAFAKSTFSCRSWGAKFSQWRDEGVERILLAGIETHVCIQQTALDLVAGGFQIYLAVDAVGTRHKIDHDVALRRMEAQGIVLTTAEAAMFEWCNEAGTDRFRAISKLAKESPPGRR